jgi:hypothetical protein
MKWCSEAQTACAVRKLLTQQVVDNEEDLFRTIEPDRSTVDISARGVP